jgi:SH3-like domain-containing protein
MKRALTISAALSLILNFTVANVYGLCTKVSTANLRRGPGMDYEICWKVPKYMFFKKVGVSLSGDWYAVKDVDGDVMWIHTSLVTAKQQCAVVNTEEVNVRTGPGVNYEKAFSDPAEKYYSFRVLSRKGSWVLVEDEDNNAGWIHSDYLWMQ